MLVSVKQLTKILSLIPEKPEPYVYLKIKVPVHQYVEPLSSSPFTIHDTAYNELELTWNPREQDWMLDLKV